MKFTIVTGLSGAGRSSALRRLEDLGYYCVDNLMPELIPSFALVYQKSAQKFAKAAVAVDTRMGDFFNHIYSTIEKLKTLPDLELDILFLDASDETLVKRFKEVRRKHPITHSGEILGGIYTERQQLQKLKDISNHVIDTTSYNLMKLCQVIDTLYADDTDKRLLISILSFGYKHGIPLDADIIFDVRFINNPFYVEGMRNQCGLDHDVKEYVLSFEQSKFFLDSLTNMVITLAPSYLQEDKKHLVIAIGCTGGVHRSVAIANELYRRLNENSMRVTIEHRILNVKR